MSKKEELLERADTYRTILIDNNLVATANRLIDPYVDMAERGTHHVKWFGPLEKNLNKLSVLYENLFVDDEQPKTYSH